MEVILETPFWPANWCFNGFLGEWVGGLMVMALWQTSEAAFFGWVSVLKVV